MIFTSPFRYTVLVKEIIPLPLFSVSQNIGNQSQPSEPILNFLIIWVLVRTGRKTRVLKSVIERVVVERDKREEKLYCNSKERLR